MLTFKSFLSEAKMSLKHIAGDSKGQNPFNHQEMTDLVKTGKVNFGNVTEKTDGQAFEIGWKPEEEHPEGGFVYAKYSGSGVGNYPKIEDHEKRAKIRAPIDNPYDKDLEKQKVIKNVTEAHRTLSENKPLVEMLKQQSQNTGQVATIKGELFTRASAKPSESQPGQLKWQGTSYRPDIIARQAGFVVHTGLEENHWLKDSHDKIKSLSTPEIKFDHDVIKHNVPDLDVEDVKKKLSQTDPKDKEALGGIRQELSDRIKSHWWKHAPSPKWGNETEGYVVHPSNASPDQPRFKLTSPQQQAKMKAQMNA